MNKNILLTGFVALVACLFIQHCSRPKEAEPAAEPAQEAPPVSVTLSSEALAAGGIATEPARLVSVAQVLTVPGEVLFNPRKYVHITARAAGRIEEVLAFAGDKVRTGQVLLRLYSPEFLSLQAEYLQAADRVSREDYGEEDRLAAADLLDSAANKLRLLEITAQELDELGRTGKVLPLLAVRAPFGGSVIESRAVRGDHVEPGASFFKLADLATLWVTVHIFEKDLSLVSPGYKATVRVDAYPGQEFPGRLSLISDVVDEKTRTAEGRVEVSNVYARLKPGMYAQVELAGEPGAQALVVPETALQDHEGRTIVFVQRAENVFAVRPVTVGRRSNGGAVILDGLTEGERVATAGSFLLKSEWLKSLLGEEGHRHD